MSTARIASLLLCGTLLPLTACDERADGPLAPVVEASADAASARSGRVVDNYHTRGTNVSTVLDLANGFAGQILIWEHGPYPGGVYVELYLYRCDGSICDDILGSGVIPVEDVQFGTRKVRLWTDTAEDPDFWVSPDGVLDLTFVAERGTRPEVTREEEVRPSGDGLVTYYTVKTKTSPATVSGSVLGLAIEGGTATIETYHSHTVVKQAP